MNALSLIPGIGTTLQLWRLLQNVIVIMSKSVTTMAGAKTEGVALKTNIQDLKGDFEKMADPNAIASAAANNAMSQASGGGNPAAAAGALGGGAAAGALMKGGSAHDGRKLNHLRSIKKYKREYKQSIREIRKTRKNILRRIKNMI